MFQKSNGEVRERFVRGENLMGGDGAICYLLFVCEKISDIILIKMKSICVNVNSVILAYVDIILKGGEFDENSTRVRDSGTSLRSGTSASLPESG